MIMDQNERKYYRQSQKDACPYICRVVGPLDRTNRSAIAELRTDDCGD